MPANNLMRLLMSALAVGSCLTLPVVVERYPVCGCSYALPLHYWSPASLPASVISLAMLGVDPRDFDKLDNPNSGLKDGIFTTTSTATDCTNARKWNNFIGRAVQDLRCPHLSSLSMRSVYNYKEYRHAISESVSFKSKDDVIVGSRRLSATSSSEFASSVNDEEQKLVQFFQRGGEVVLAEARCQTHTVSVNLYTRPTFTPNFHWALTKLCVAAENPNAEKSQKIFFDFIEAFGTHYQDTTHFGSRLLIMKLFVRKATSSSEKNERHRCVSSSFTQNLRKNSSLDDVVEHFNRDVTRCADSERAQDVLNSLGLPPTRILTVGTVPLPDLDQTLRRPVPIHYRVEKIHTMFQEDWFDSLGCSVDGAVMQEFFENMTSLERRASNGTSCAGMVGCGYNSNCKLREKCFSDKSTSEGFFCKNSCEVGDICTDDKVDLPDTNSEGFSFKKACGSTANCPPQKVCVDDTSAPGFTCREPCSVPGICASDEACYAEQHSQRGYICVSTKPGRAVILGGWDGGELQTVQQVNLGSFPELPAPLYSTAAARSGQHVVVCGGWTEGERTKVCYEINFNSPGSGWGAMPSAPVAMVGHTAVSVGQSIVWFIGGRQLVVFDGATRSFSILNLPFDATDYHCSVTNNTHAYIVGAGSNLDEIWVNKRSMDGTEWRQVANITRRRYFHACLWYGSNIMITGGLVARSDVEMFNTETGEVWAGQPLLTGREGHQMMLLDGRPTVIGGQGNNGKYLSTFESFSLESNRWEKLERTLAGPRKYFALVDVSK